MTERSTLSRALPMLEIVPATPPSAPRLPASPADDRLAEYLPEARVTGVAAGMHLVVTLSSTVDDRALADRASAAGLGALALSGTRLRAAGPPGLVLGYAACSAERFRSAVRAVSQLIG